MLFLVYVILLPVVCFLLRRCWLPSPRNFAALKQFGVCDNKLFDFDFDFCVVVCCVVLGCAAFRVVLWCVEWILVLCCVVCVEWMFHSNVPPPPLMSKHLSCCWCECVSLCVG